MQMFESESNNRISVMKLTVHNAPQASREVSSDGCALTVASATVRPIMCPTINVTETETVKETAQHKLATCRVIYHYKRKKRRKVSHLYKRTETERMDRYFRPPLMDKVTL